MFSYRIGFWSVLAESWVLSGGRVGQEGRRKVSRCHCLIKPLCTMRQKCLSLSLWGWKIFCKIFWTFRTIAGAVVQSGVSEGVSSSRNLWLFIASSEPAIARPPQLVLLSSFQVFAKCSHKFSCRIFSGKSRGHNSPPDYDSPVSV